MEQDIKTQLLTKRPIDLLFQLSVPAVIGMTVIGLYPLMDGVFAGNIIGQTAMTACGVATTLTIFNNGVSTLVGIGSASVLSRALGKGDQKTVDKIMGNLIFWVILFSVIITVGVFLAETYCPSELFTPNLFDSLSRPFLELPTPFLLDIALHLLFVYTYSVCIISMLLL